MPPSNIRGGPWVTVPWHYTHARVGTRDQAAGYAYRYSLKFLRISSSPLFAMPDGKHYDHIFKVNIRLVFSLALALLLV